MQNLAPHLDGVSCILMVWFHCLSINPLFVLCRSNLQDSTATYFQSPEWKSKIAEIEKNAQSLSKTAKQLANNLEI